MWIKAIPRSLVKVDAHGLVAARKNRQSDYKNDTFTPLMIVVWECFQ